MGSNFRQRQKVFYKRAQKLWDLYRAYRNVAGGAGAHTVQTERLLGGALGPIQCIRNYYRGFWDPYSTYIIRNENPTDVTVSILFIYRRISTCFGPTGPSSGEITQLFTQPLVQYPYRSGLTTYRTRDQNGTDTEPMVV